MTRSSFARASSAPSRWPSSRRIPRSRSCGLPSRSSAPDPRASRWRVRSPNSRSAPSSTTSAGSTRPVRGCCCSTGAGAPCHLRRSALREGHAGEIERTGVELRMGSRVTDVKPEAIVVQGPGGEERSPATRRCGRRACRAPAGGAGAGHRRGDGPRRARRSASRLHPPGPSRGVRRRGHDVAERASRGSRGGDAVGHPRGPDDQTAPRRGTRRSPSSIAISAAWRRSPASGRS